MEHRSVHVGCFFVLLNELFLCSNVGIYVDINVDTNVGVNIAKPKSYFCDKMQSLLVRF